MAATDDRIGGMRSMVRLARHRLKPATEPHVQSLQTGTGTLLPRGTNRPAATFAAAYFIYFKTAANGVRDMASSVLIGILITFLVIILVLYLVQRLPLDGRTRQIVQIVVIIIGIISLLKYLAVF
jgi:uncharacterized membrane-anchored protein